MPVSRSAPARRLLDVLGRAGGAVTLVAVLVLAVAAGGLAAGTPEPPTVTVTYGGH